MLAVIYEATFASGRRYIGVTTSFNTRKHNHRHYMAHGKHPSPLLQAEYDACGVFPEFRVLVSCLDPFTRFALESQVIEQNKPELNMPRPERTFEINGKSYSTNHAAQTFGVRGGLILQRLDSGWTPEQAVELEPCPQKLKGDATRAAAQQRQEQHLVEFEGEKVRLSELCNRDGIPYNRAKRRIDAGLTYAEVRRWWFGPMG